MILSQSKHTTWYVLITFATKFISIQMSKLFVKQTETSKKLNGRNYKPLIWALTIIINGLIIFAFYFPYKKGINKFDLSFLPLLNAILNGATFVFLILALLAIRAKKIRIHRNFILAAFIATSVFLLSYLLYHFTTPSTRFGASGAIKYLYYFILITHVSLAIIPVPLALISMGRGLNMEIEKHRRITRWSMPVWLYVSLTGVIVYILISPYYS